MALLTPPEILAFKAKFNIPDDVEVRVVKVDEPLIGIRESIPIYTHVITKSSMRFPFHTHLVWVLSSLKLCLI